MNTHQFLLAAVFLLLVLVGAALPALIQLFLTLKRARVLLETAGPRLERTLLHMSEAVERLDSIGSTLETRARAVDEPPRGAAAEWLKRAAVFGSAFAPAAVAGVKSMMKGNGRRWTR